MRSQHAFVLAAAIFTPALVPAFACSSHELAGDAPVMRIGQPIMGGDTDQNDPAVVGVVMMAGGGIGLCSGSLIAPNLVLTAHHCVAQVQSEEITCGVTGFGSVYAGSAFHVTTDWDGPEVLFSTYKMTGNWFGAKAAMVPPNTSADVCGGDIALIELSSNIPPSLATPLIPRIDQVVAAGETYTAIGFGGVDDDGDSSGTRRILKNLKVDCSGTCMAAYVDNGSEWQGDKGVCPGDSGGPATDTLGRVIGATSRGGTGCTTPVYTGVYAWADWLKANALQAAIDGNYDPPSWAIGAPTDGGAWDAPSDAPAAGQIGAKCVTASDCNSGVCVPSDLTNNYCSVSCAQDDTTCPDGYVCDSSQWACVKKGALGAPCSVPSDCATNLCVGGNNDFYCSIACNKDVPICPGTLTCSTTLNACFLPSPAPVAAKGGCSVGASGSTNKSVQWIAAIGLLGILLRRRRRA